MTPRILAVDDRPENLLAVEAVLAPLGAQVVCAGSGAEALRHLLKGEFAVVLLDVEMPGLDGFETAELIRARPRSATLPIIFLTAATHDQMRVVKGYATGAIDFLTKPVSPEIIRAKVGAFLELHKRGELIRQQERELEEARRIEDEQRKATELERQLVGVVGHDIRAPLSAILATAQTQLRGAELGPAQRRSFERVERSAQRIQQVVSLLLDYTRARIGRGIPLATAPTSLAELAQKAVEEFEAGRPDRRVRLGVDSEDLQGEWDGPRLSQVLANLLDNAAKYSPPDEAIDVRMGGDAEQTWLEVRNGGEPIPPDRLAQLFEPFERAGEESHAGSSLGLGLFIVREIVRGHGGTVVVSSAVEAGTCFRITLPRRRAEAAPSNVAQAN
jgi:signal transduction histidine kinase